MANSEFANGISNGTENAVQPRRISRFRSGKLDCVTLEGLLGAQANAYPVTTGSVVSVHQAAGCCWQSYALRIFIAICVMIVLLPPTLQL